jgi:HTH-type transcriptional regulator/antitoxin MqsA
MRYERRPDTIEYMGKQRTIRALGFWCDKCGEAIFTGKEVMAQEKVFLQLKAEAEGVLGPKDVARVRKKLRMSQRKAGALLGGGPRAFQKYECGTQAVSTPMSHLLRLLDNDPKRVNEIREAVAKYERRKGKKE